MIVFQLVAVPLCVLFFWRSLVRFVRGDRHRLLALFGMLLWAGAGAAIARPELTNLIAGGLGIGRGADLVSYLSAISFLAAFFYFYQKTRKLESDLTTVVRSLALQDATRRWPDDRSDPGQH